VGLDQSIWPADALDSLWGRPRESGPGAVRRSSPSLRRKTNILLEMSDASDDGLRLSELRPSSGSWRGHLFDNPTLGIPAALSWTFELEYAQIDRDYGSSPVGLTIDWVPLPCRTWRQMKGHSATCTRFGDPVEASIYFFEHYRYDAAAIAVVEQEDDSIQVVGTIGGDIDGLGVGKVEFAQWLRFDGIYVNLHAPTPTSPQEAEGRLGEFVDPQDLVSQPVQAGSVFRFVRSRA
jgi:hypothetical protein